MMRNQEEFNMLSRYRSPVFSKVEIKTLLDVIDKYKSIILNRSISGNACRAKEVAWANITKLFNASGFVNQRNTESLRMKWENLKKEARKAYKMSLEGGETDCDETIKQIVAMMSIDVNTNDISVPIEIGDNNDGLFRVELEELQKNIADHIESNENEGYSKMEDDNINDYKQQVKSESDASQSLCAKTEGPTPTRNRLLPRSKNFTPQESSLLLKCVRPEKKYVFNSGTSPGMITLKNRAWIRITHAFNKQSPTKRSLNCLRQKFYNMKRMGKKLGFMNNTDENTEPSSYPKASVDNYEIVVENIKIEPKNYNDHEDSIFSDDGQNNDSLNERHDRDNVSPDPLNVNFNSDFKYGVQNMVTTRVGAENYESSTLTQELLKYQLENAKLERKRIEDLMRAEARASETRATEMALRLRAARLEAVAAALKFPPAHPALAYAQEEKRAEDYINCCEQ